MEKDIVFGKTRIAPTPSGYLHLGNVLSFAVTAALAKKTGAKVLLRIDDMDRERVKKEYVQDIFDTLNFLEIGWDEGPRDMQEFEREYSQVFRMRMYREVLERLRDRGDVFACGCSRAEVLRGSLEGVYGGICRDRGISLDAKNVNWRIRTDERELAVRTLAGVGIGFGGTGQTRVTEEGRGGMVRATLPAVMKDFVVRKRDGFPAYQLTCVVDDLFYGVDLVVRGVDLWDSTVAQHYLAGVLAEERADGSARGKGFGGITFYHHPLLVMEGRKLSKSAGDTSVRYLRGEGLKPADVCTRIAGMLGHAGPVGNWEELAGLLL